MKLLIPMRQRSKNKKGGKNVSIKGYGRGDLILTVNPSKLSGEVNKLRPWLVVSEKALNKYTPFVWALPVTRRTSSYPLAYTWSKEESPLGEEGTLLCDHLTTIDTWHHKCQLIGHIEVPVDIDKKVKAILGYE